MSVSVKISQLVDGGALTSNDYLPISRGALDTFKIAASQLVTAGSNIGTGTGTVFRGSVDGATGRTLQLRTLQGEDGISIVPSGDTLVVSASGQNPIKTSIVGDGVTTQWPIAGNFHSVNPNNYRVDIDGVLQESLVNYNIAGSNIVFVTPPPLNSKVTVVSNNLLRIFDIVPSDGSVNLNKITANAVSTVKIVNGAVTNEKIAFNGGSFSFRNKLINGNFDVWQRGTSLGSGAGSRYLADRWLNSSVGSTYTTTRQIFTPGQTTVTNEPRYFHRTIVNSVAGSSNFVSLSQLIESVRTLAGKTVTCSFWGRTTGSNKFITARLNQNFGTGGSNTVFVVPTTNFLLTTTWQKFTFTVNVPSISSRIIGSNNNDSLVFEFLFDAGVSLNSTTNNLGQQSGTFDIAQCQVEEGPTATPFEEKNLGLELLLCQRYYEKSYGLEIVPGTPSSLTGIIHEYPYYSGPGSFVLRYMVTFNTQKRRTPDVVVYNPNTGSTGQAYTDNHPTPGTTSIAISPIAPSETSFIAGGVNVGSGWANYFIHYTADAEI